jgi:hypothetical protein
MLTPSRLDKNERLEKTVGGRKDLIRLLAEEDTVSR